MTFNVDEFEREQDRLAGLEAMRNRLARQPDPRRIMRRDIDDLSTGVIVAMLAGSFVALVLAVAVLG